MRVPPSGTWEHRRADLYAAAEDWLGPSAMTGADAVEHLVRRYLGGFGPANPLDRSTRRQADEEAERLAALHA